MRKVRALLSIFEGGAWHFPGQDSEVFEVTEERYERIKDHVGEIDMDEVEDPPMEIAEVVEVHSDEIPAGFPYRTKLEAKNIITLDQLREIEDISALSGFGKKSAATILAALEELG